MPTVSGYGSFGDLPFVVMEMADRGTLLDVLSADSAWDVRLDMLQQIACATKFLHDNDIVHGDIKLENVLVFSKDNGRFQAKLSDFSHSTYQLDRSQPSSPYQYYGTWPMIPPEVWCSPGEVVGKKCDIWAYSVLLWQVCHYRNDDAVKRLRFTPRHDDVLSVGLVSEQAKLLEAAWLDLGTILCTSDTVDVSHRHDMSSIFAHCFEPTPSTRLSAHVLCDQIMAVTGDTTAGLGTSLSAMHLEAPRSPDHTEVRLGASANSAEDDENGSQAAPLPAWKAFEASVPMSKVSLSLCTFRALLTCHEDDQAQSIVGGPEGLLC